MAPTDGDPTTRRMAYELSVRRTRFGPVSLALYRRYRPDTFADLIAQEHVTDPLMQALRTGRVGHAYLFSGPRGCGKTTSARILARCLNCEQGPTDAPCGTCESCVALARGGPGSVDVIEIDAASHGGVDDARDLRERASYAPAQSRYKVYIIDEAHMVTPQGFNALLKIVEEPPEHVKFVFATTEPEKVIGTIRSRTHHYPFRLVPPARLTAYLEELCRREEIAVAPGVLSFVVRAGAGSVRDALSVLDQLIAGSGDEGLTYERAVALLGFTDGELLDATIDGIGAGDAAAVFRQVDKVVESGLDPRRFVEDLLERLRDLIIVAAVPDGAAAVFREVPQDQLDRLRTQQGYFGPGELSRAADIVNAGLTEMTGATSPRLQLELICARVLLPGAAGESGYAARLDRLERRLDAAGSAPPTGPAAASGPPARPAVAQQPPAREPVSAPPAAPVPTSAPVATSASVAPPAQTAPVPTPSPAPTAPPAPTRAAPTTRQPAAAAALDVDKIRRAWPAVLKKIYSMRRATWSFLNEHAQVHDYDGTRLVLAIANPALASTFRSGNHAELVRQALIDELALDLKIEGVVVSAPAPATHSAAPATQSSPPGVAPAPASNPPTRRPAARESKWPGADPEDPFAGQGPDWGERAAATPAPDWATASTGPAAPTPSAHPASSSGAPAPMSAVPAPAADTALGAAFPDEDDDASDEPEALDVSGHDQATSADDPVDPADQITLPTAAEPTYEELRDEADVADLAVAGPDVIKSILGGRVISDGP